MSMFSPGIQSLIAPGAGGTANGAATAVGATNTGSSQTQETSQAQGGQQLDMNSFLLMFTTQLKYQDPSSPLQSYELAAQLAQFSTVSELTKLNQAAQMELSYLSSINNAQMIGTIGKEVLGQNDTIQLKDGQITKGAYKIDAPATSVTVKITDDKGKVLRTMELSQQEAGSHAITWNGLNDNGEQVANGDYHFDVTAIGEDGKEMDVQETISGKVYAFRVEAGIPYLILGGADGVKLPISGVMQVQENAEA